MTRVLVAGWFSFHEVVATVGDERGAEVVSGWLAGAGVAHDVAWARFLGRGPTWQEVDPAAYTHLLFVCGPVMPTPLLDALLDRFAHCRRLAVGVSVVDAATADRFDRVWARDDGTALMADLAVDAGPPAPLVVATVFAPPQDEYGARGRHDHVRRTVEEWVSDRGLGWFDVETDMLTHAKLPRTAAQTQAALGRADVVVSSRLHGLVLGLGQGRPVIACDPVAGGAKVTAQAVALGWPVVVAAELIGPGSLDNALAACLAPGLPARLGGVAAARAAFDPVRRELLGDVAP